MYQLYKTKIGLPRSEYVDNEKVAFIIFFFSIFKRASHMFISVAQHREAPTIV
jgi:hypothetical protein